MNFLLLSVDTFDMGEALLLSLLYLIIIVLTLGALIGVIYLLRYFLFRLERSTSNKKSKKQQIEEQTDTQPVLAAEAKGSSGNINIYNVKPKDAALIMAIVADKLKTPLNRLRFKSIKQVNEGEDKNEIQG